MKRFGLTPRRVVVLCLLVAIAYWIMHYSDLARTMGFSGNWKVAPVGYLGTKDIKADLEAEVLADNPL